jgi:hypothetical protein
MAIGTGPTVEGIARLRVIVEAAGSFCVDQTSSPGLASYTAVPAIEGTIEFPAGQLETIPTNTLVQTRWDYPEEIIGKKKPVTLKFSMWLAPTGTVTSDGVTAVQGALGLILKAVMGGESLGTGTRAVAGWTSSAGSVDAGEGGSMLAGNALAWVNASGIAEAREIEQRSTDALTLKRALSGTPSNTNTLYGSATYYMSSDPDTSLQFVVEGAEQTDRWLLLGCQMTSMALDLPIGSENAAPKITFTFESTSWLYGDDCATPITGSDLAVSTYSNFSPIAGYAGRFMAQTVTTATFTGSTVDVSAVSFDPKWSFGRVTSPSGTMATLRWLAKRQAAACIEGSFQTYFSDFSHFDWRDNKTDLAMTYQIGTSVAANAGVVLISVPTAQVVEVMRNNADGVANETIKFKGRNDSETVLSPATDLSRSPFRIHLIC